MAEESKKNSTKKAGASAKETTAKTAKSAAAKKETAAKKTSAAKTKKETAAKKEPAAKKKAAASKPPRAPRESELGLKMYYQPIMQPMFGRLIAYEGFVRLIDKQLHFVSPNEFIPIAEKSGLSVALSNWIFEESCRFIKKMEKKNMPFEYISLNVSTKHLLRKDFASDVQEILEGADVSPEQICLEVAEFAMASKGSLVMSRMDEMRSLGFKVAIDDFGGDYAALSKLPMIPADILKLDKRFVDRIVMDEKSREITASIISMATKLNLEVVAKAVESENQQKLLMGMGCQKMQGYLFGKPMKEKDILTPKKSRSTTEDEEA